MQQKLVSITMPPLQMKRYGAQHFAPIRILHVLPLKTHVLALWHKINYEISSEEALLSKFCAIASDVISIYIFSVACASLYVACSTQKRALRTHQHSVGDRGETNLMIMDEQVELPLHQNEAAQKPRNVMPARSSLGMRADETGSTEEDSIRMPGPPSYQMVANGMEALDEQTSSTPVTSHQSTKLPTATNSGASPPQWYKLQLASAGYYYKISMAVERANRQ